MLKSISWIMVSFVAISLLLAPMQRVALATDGPFVSKTIEGDFEEVFAGLKDVIIGKGINIAHTLGSAEMLNRTAPAFNIKKNVFINADIVEFCSAKLSHELVAVDPKNIVLCPFTISVYVLTDDPKHFHLTYRIPTANKGSEKVVGKVVKLVKGILAEATDW